MQITIISVGKLKEKYLIQGIDEYLKRLSKYAKVKIEEVPDEQAPDQFSEAEEKQVKQKEGEKIFTKLSTDHYVITLDLEGKQLTSEQFAQKLDDLATYGKSKVAFVIGGSLGLSDDIKQRSDLAISFSKMTYPHQLMRLILVEQVYRAFRIMRGEPYHK